MGVELNKVYRQKSTGRLVEVVRVEFKDETPIEKRDPEAVFIKMDGLCLVKDPVHDEPVHAEIDDLEEVAD